MTYAFLDKAALDDFVKKSKEAGLNVRKEIDILVENSKGEVAACVGVHHKNDKCVYAQDEKVAELLIDTANAHGCHHSGMR